MIEHYLTIMLITTSSLTLAMDDKSQDSQKIIGLFQEPSKLTKENAKKLRLIQFVLKEFPQIKQINSNTINFYEKKYLTRKPNEKKKAHYTKIQGDFYPIIEKYKERLTKKNVIIRKTTIKTPYGKKTHTNIIFKPPSDKSHPKQTKKTTRQSQERAKTYSHKNLLT